MSWRQLHRWLGLSAGSIAVLVGITGLILAFFPIKDIWQAASTPGNLTVATLVERAAVHTPGIESIKRLPEGGFVVYAFDGEQARAHYVDPVDGKPLGDYQVSTVYRWVKNLHRSFMLDDYGRMAAAVVALSLLLLAGSGLELIARRQGGWTKIFARSKGNIWQRTHVVAGQFTVIFLLLSSLTGLYMSAVTFEWIPPEPDWDPDVASQVVEADDLPVSRMAALQNLPASDLVKLNFPTNDPEDVWELVTTNGQGFVDRYSGDLLAWEPVSFSTSLYNTVLMLHTAQGVWWLALLLGVMAACLPLFAVTGVVLWWQGRPKVRVCLDNAPVSQADTLIYVASEGGSTWGFVKALHDALQQAGHRVHAAPLEKFSVGTAVKQIFVLAATYGDGQAPAHAAKALARIIAAPVAQVPVGVVGLGDRQYPRFCGYAENLQACFQKKGWPILLPLETIHQQSAQQFMQWCRALSERLGEPLTVNYEPYIPVLSDLVLLSRQEFTEGQGEPAVILRFKWQSYPLMQRLKGKGIGKFLAGDLVGILPPSVAVPRYYSLASSCRDGFLEICIRRMKGGLCSTWLYQLEPGDVIQGFIRHNEGFRLPSGRQPVVLIATGTGIAPMAGFIRNNTRKQSLHLYFGIRHPDEDFYYQEEFRRWQEEGKLQELRLACSRVESGRQHVQDVLRKDADTLTALVKKGAAFRVCGNRVMANGVEETLNELFLNAGVTVEQLKNDDRYAEDIF